MTSTIPAHSHIVNDPGHNHGGSTDSSTTSYLSYSGTAVSFYLYSGSYVSASTHSHSIQTDYTNIILEANGSHTHTINGTTGSTGMGQPFNIMPPYQTVHYIIRANL
ncbi:unnamed protein product [Adineta ricciae]|uniref:Uncharacterized protein n=1 Tax=Adineta ricciae TaxID=249248 RepID=A0A815XHY2_ADIRI|nr:unnamed protein product [Adineta ricciae]CAF1558055.1 unnamed protein product [Adineta ricciae]